MSQKTKPKSHPAPSDTRSLLVTGAAGFIGSKVCQLLIADGHQVVGVDNLNDAYDVRLKKWRLEQLKPDSNFQYHPLDISDRKGVRRFFDSSPSFDAVINLAARAGVRYSVENPWIYFDTNLTGTLNLLEACQKLDIKKFILASTSSLYGIRNPRPFHEDANTDGPLSPYAASKKGAEALCYTYHHLYSLDVTVFRYFTVYGPAGRPDMSPFRFVQWISEERPVIVYGDGTQERDFVYVDDIARGTIAGLKPIGYEVINLGSDHPIVLNAMIGQIEELTGKKAKIVREPRHPADMTATWANISKAERLLGWRPKIPFKDGVVHLVTWYQQNREWVKDIRTD